MKKLQLKDGTMLNLTAYADNRYSMTASDHKEVMSVWDKMTKDNMEGALLYEDDTELCQIVQSEPFGMRCSDWGGDIVVTFEFQNGRTVKRESALTEKEARDIEVAHTIVGDVDLTKEEAKDARVAIEDACSTAMPDETAVKLPSLLPEWSGDGIEYKTGHKVSYKGEPYKILQDHISQADWTPEMAPSLFARILPGQDGTKVGEWIQPDSTNPYKIGDRVKHKDKIYESLIDGNVWEPGAEGSQTLWKEVQ